MGLKKLSQSLLLSLAIFAGAAELRAHVTPEAKVSPNLTIARKQAPLQKKNLGFGFSAYLRYSARSLAGSFVSAVAQAKNDRALASKRPQRQAKQATNHLAQCPKAKVGPKSMVIAAVCLLPQNEDLSHTWAHMTGADLPPAQPQAFAQALLWNFTAIPPGAEVSARPLYHQGAAFALSRPISGLAECESLKGCYNACWVTATATTVTVFKARLSHRAAIAAGIRTTQPINQPAYQAAMAPGLSPTSAPADSNGINPPSKQAEFQRLAAAAQLLPRLG